MLPISLLIWLLIEIASYLAFARLGLDAAWDKAALIALWGLLGLRFNIVAFTWFFASRHSSPAPRLAPGASFRMMIEEYFAFLKLFLLVIPFERLWMPADRLPSDQNPILLVHGYGCSRGVWWKIRGELEAAGHTVASVSLFPPYTSIGKLVPQLAARIEAVCKATGAQQVTLVAHSMGGLVCRSYLARHGIGQVARLITLATPHQGSQLARHGIGQNAREMEPGSVWLKDISVDPVKIPCISVRTPHDNYVMPQDNQRLPGAKDIEMPGIGHLAMLTSPRTVPVLLRCLEMAK